MFGPCFRHFNHNNTIFVMFLGDMKEADSNEIILHDTDPTAIDLLLEYAYSGQIVITPDNVQVLLPASSLLQMQDVREACCRFLLRQLHPTNCLGIRSFAGTMICHGECNKNTTH